MVRLLRKLSPKLLLPVILIAIAIPFQNCSQKGSLTQEEDLPSRQGAGNGSGYDGKIFVHVSTENCGDNKGYDSAIEGRAGEFYLTRDNCADIPLASQTRITVQLNPSNRKHIYYREELYVETLNVGLTIVPVPDGFVGSGSLFPVVDGKLTSVGNYIGRFDREGRPAWAKLFGKPLYTTSVKVDAMPDGGLVVIAMQKADPFSTVEKYKTWLARFSRTGKFMWSRQLHSGTAEFTPNNMKADKNGAIHIAGVARGLSAKNLGWIAKLNAKGQVIYSRSIDSGDNASPRFAFSPLSGEPYIIANNYMSGFTLMKLDGSGAAIWSRAWPSLRDATLRFAPDGDLTVQAVFVTNVPGTSIYESHSRVLELGADGSPKTAWKFSDDLLNKRGRIQMLKADDGAMYVTITNRAHAFTVIRLNTDFTAAWGFEMPLSDGFEYLVGHHIEGSRFFSNLDKASSLPGFGTAVLTPVDLSNFPARCLGKCQSLLVTTTAATDSQLAMSPTAGPPTDGASHTLTSTPIEVKAQFSESDAALPVEPAY